MIIRMVHGMQQQYWATNSTPCFVADLIGKMVMHRRIRLDSRLRFLESHFQRLQCTNTFAIPPNHHLFSD